MTTHAGGCHCGKVRCEVDAPASIEADECNCSICGKSGHLHLIVPADDFRLLRGGDDL
ncbi:MAG: GFA family protein [Woeseiaceae bacterium]